MGGEMEREIGERSSGWDKEEIEGKGRERGQ